MRRISVEELQSGMTLGRSIYSSANTLLLAAGQNLDDRYVTLLREHNFGPLYVEEEGFEDINPQDILSETTRRAAEASINNSYLSLRDALRIRTTAETLTYDFLIDNADVFAVPNVDEMSQAVGAIIRDIIDRSVGVVDVFAEATRDTYMYRHAVNVVAVSILIARQFGFSNRQLRQLGLGALLHEVGKVCLGDAMLRPEHELDDTAGELYREHPTFGGILLQNADPTLKAERLTILHHREWQDGSGWPQGLRGDNLPPVNPDAHAPNRIHPYAEIVAVANAYDNLVNGTGEIPRRLRPAEALGMIMTFARRSFNQAVCHVFSRIVCLFPTGSMVRIEESSSFGLEGYYGVVKDQGDDPSRPVLILYADPDGRRVRPRTLDFSHDPDLRLRILY